MTSKLIATTTASVVVMIALTGCGGKSIEDRVADEYPDYARNHGFAGSTTNDVSVNCSHEATKRYDGWCRIRPKGFHLTYDVPYQGDKLYWGESGVSKAPGGS